MAAKKVQSKLKIHLLAWKATPAPPVGPMLWQHGINIGAFTKEFNDKTRDLMQKFGGFDVKIPVEVTVYIDRSFEMKLKSPVSSDLIKWKAKIKKGSGEPNTKKVGSISMADLKEIAEMKKADMNTDDIDAIVRSLIGTAKSLWIEIKE
jgi:large subunit ribosomal protein L11